MDGTKGRKPTFNEQLLCARLSAHVANRNLFSCIGVVHHGDTPQARVRCGLLVGTWQTYVV